MELGPYVDALRAELLAAADPGEASTLAERLVAAVASATRLTILDVLSAASDEITRELAPGSVEVRLRGRDPVFVVTPPPAAPSPEDPATETGEARDAVPEAPVVTFDGPTSRINFRPPEQLKHRIEQAAADEGLSVNAWLNRASSAALDGPTGRGNGAARPGRFTGWVG